MFTPILLAFAAAGVTLAHPGFLSAGALDIGRSSISVKSVASIDSKASLSLRKSFSRAPSAGNPLARIRLAPNRATVPTHFIEENAGIRHQFSEYMIRPEFQDKAGVEKYFTDTKTALSRADLNLADAERTLKSLESDPASSKASLSKAKQALYAAQKSFEDAEKEYLAIGTFLERHLTELNRAELERMYEVHTRDPRPPAFQTIYDDEEFSKFDDPDMPSA